MPGTSGRKGCPHPMRDLVGRGIRKCRKGSRRNAPPRIECSVGNRPNLNQMPRGASSYRKTKERALPDARNRGIHDQRSRRGLLGVTPDRLPDAATARSPLAYVFALYWSRPDGADGSVGRSGGQGLRRRFLDAVPPIIYRNAGTFQRSRDLINSGDKPLNLAACWSGKRDGTASDSQQRSDC